MLVVIFAPPNIALASPEGGPISTGLLRDTGAGAAPIIKAKWEMNGHYTRLLGTDASRNPGAQFNAPGIWGSVMDYSICAVVTDPDGVSDIDSAYVDIFYPQDTAFHPMDASQSDQISGGTKLNPDFGLNGCALQRRDEGRMKQLSKTDGYSLFCDNIRNNNGNLPTFYPEYNYNEICAPDGELMKETAYVYCADKELIWEDPAGDYSVLVFALDKAGVFSNRAENNFTYLPLTSYEVDFTAIDYGNVKLNTHKIISGDLDFGTSNKPTVRNTGNTRIYMGVVQDDMGMGTTDGQWNVRYDARVGNNEADWKNFDPEEHLWLEDILDLSETEEMDFSILVQKFPLETPTYHGNMTLDAKFAQFRQCDGVQEKPTFTADLSLEKSVSESSVETGQQATFTLTVSNSGPDIATGVTVEDTLPQGVTYMSDDSGGDYNTISDIWTLGAISAGSNASINIIVTVDQDGEVANTAQVATSDQTDPDSTPDNNIPGEDDQDSASVTGFTPQPEPQPDPEIDLSLEKTVSSDAVTVGATVTYTLTVSNSGPDTATGVTVEDILPAGVTWADDDSDDDYNTGNGIWTVGAIVAGSNASINIIATVDQDGEITNTAQVESANQADTDSTPGNAPAGEDDEASITLTATAPSTPSADLELKKTVTSPNPLTPIAGIDPVTYHITISNNGPDVATNVEIADILPAPLSYASHLASAGVYVPGTSVWTIPSIAASGSAVLDITVNTAQVVISQEYTNSAQVIASDQADPDSIPKNSAPDEDDQDTASILIIAPAPPPPGPGGPGF